MAAPIAPDAFSHNPERGGGVFARVQDRIAQGSSPEGASGQEMAAKAIGKDLDVPDTRQSPSSSNEVLPAPNRTPSLTDRTAVSSSPGGEAGSSSFPGETPVDPREGASLFDPEHTQSWGGRGDYHYVYTPGNPAKGTGATITLHGGKRGKAPVTIGENGQNAAAFKAILDEYKEMEGAEGVNPFMAVDKYEPAPVDTAPDRVATEDPQVFDRESMINQAAQEVMSENESAPGGTSLGDRLFQEQSRMAPEPGAKATPGGTPAMAGGQEGMLSRIGNDLYDSMGAAGIKGANVPGVRRIAGNMDNAPASTVDGANVESQLDHLGAKDMYASALEALFMKDTAKASEMADGLTKHPDASMQNLGKGLQNLISMQQGN